MERIQDLTATCLLLRRGIDAGYWTLEDLDTPSPGWAENAKRFRLDNPLYVQHEYRNPLRDHHQPPAVEITSPRDFAAPSPRPGVPPGDSPLPLPRELDLALDHPGDQPEDPSADEAHRELPF